MFQSGSGGKTALGVADLDRAGHLGAHAPLGAVGVVAAPVGHLAAGVVVDPAEVDVAAGRGIRGVGGRAEPEVVLEALGDRLGLLVVARLGVVGPARGQADADALQVADPAVADQLAGAAESLVGTLLAAGLEDDLGLVDRVAHRAALGDRQRQRLLAVDVLPGLAGRDDRDRVPVVRRADLDGVDVVPAQDLAVIDVGLAAAVGPGAALASRSAPRPAAAPARGRRPCRPSSPGSRG